MLGPALVRAALSLAAGVLLFVPWLLIAAGGERGDGVEDYLAAAFWLRLLKEIAGGYPLSILLISAAAIGAA